MVVLDSSQDPRLTRAVVQQEGWRSQIIVPLKSKDRVQGVLAVATRNLRQFPAAERELVAALGNQVGVAVENAQLYREVARQLQIRQQLNEELQLTRSLEEANRLKAELISTLAHEMRTPLTSIKGYSTALLMDEIAFSAETQREFLQIIDEECTILQDLIHDLLESSIIDAGLLQLEPQPVMLPRLVQDAVEDMARRTRQHDFVLDFEDNFPIVDADPRRIEQVLRNLLDNAVKYSPDGGLIVVRGEVDDDANEVIVSVSDQGVGIAPEHLNRLFEKFFRVESGLGRHVVGSGLGLPIARTIIESHGGRIWAESQVGEGTTLHFALPLEGPSFELADREES
jgi:signal transduction histidine kinase